MRYYGDRIPFSRLSRRKEGTTIRDKFSLRFSGTLLRVHLSSRIGESLTLVTRARIPLDFFHSTPCWKSRTNRCWKFFFNRAIVKINYVFWYLWNFEISKLCRWFRCKNIDSKFETVLFVTGRVHRRQGCSYEGIWKQYFLHESCWKSKKSVKKCFFYYSLSIIIYATRE